MADIVQPDLQSLISALSAGDNRGKALATGVNSFTTAFDAARGRQAEDAKTALQRKIQEAGIVSGKAANAANPALNLPEDRAYTPDLIKVLSEKPAGLTPAQAEMAKAREAARNLQVEGERRRAAQLRLNVGRAFESLPEVKKARTALGEVANIRGIVESNTPVEAGSVPTFMARLSGEVGNLSEADKRPFGGTRAIVGRIKQAFQTTVDGRLTPENQQYIRQIIDTIEKNRTLTLRKRAESYAKTQGKLMEDPKFGTLIIDALMEGIPSVPGEQSAAPADNSDISGMTDEELQAELQRLSNGGK